MAERLKGEIKKTLATNSETYECEMTPVALCNVTLQGGRGTVTFALLKNGTTQERGPITLSRDSGGQSGDGDSQVTKVIVKGTGPGENKFTISATV